MRLIALVLLGLGTTGAWAHAQSNGAVSWPPPPGSRIRLTSPVLVGKQSGTLVSADKDSVIARLEKFSNPFAVATSNVTRMEVASGTHTTKGKGALLGFLIGGGATALITAATWKDTNGFDFGRWGDAAFAGGFIGLAGAVIGTVVGMRSTQSWESVSIPRN